MVNLSAGCSGALRSANKRILPDKLHYAIIKCTEDAIKSDPIIKITAMLA